MRSQSSLRTLDPEPYEADIISGPWWVLWPNIFFLPPIVAWSEKSNYPLMRDCLFACRDCEEKPRRFLGVWAILGEGGGLPYLWTLHVFVNCTFLSVLCLTEPILGQGGPSYLWTLRLLRITHTLPHTRTSHLSTSEKYLKHFYFQTRKVIYTHILETVL